MNWEKCINLKLVRETEVDEELIESLLVSSGNRILTNSRFELDEVSASTKISSIYESLREVLEALALKKGYKIYNHECFSGFLKEICKKEELSASFDKFRIIRNKVNYYGKKISVEDTKDLIGGMILLREEILDEYFEKVKRR